MRKLLIAAVALVTLGLVLLFLRSPGGPDSPTDRDSDTQGESRTGKGSASRAESRRYRENPEDIGVRGTADAGSTPSLAEPPSEQDGVLELEVVAGEQPVPGASVRLYWHGPRDPNLNEISWRLASSGLTDGQGHARLASRPGSYGVAVRAPGYAPLWRDVVRPLGEPRTLLRLSLERGQSLTGRTVEQGSKDPLPLVELSLTAYSESKGVWSTAEAPAEERVNAASDERGNFRVEGLSPGKYLLEAQAPGHSQAVMRYVRVPATAPLTVELAAAGVLEGFVVDAQGAPAAGAEVLVGGHKADTTTTGSGGGFSVEVEAGTYLLSARRGAEAGALDTPVIVSAGKTVRDVRIQLGQSAALQGTVVAGGSGAPVEGARVDVSPYGSSGDCGRAVTDGTGHFTVENLAPGSYDLVVTAPGFAPLTRRALTVAPGEHFPIELKLIGTGTVEGEVQDGNGQPVAGAQVVSANRWGSTTDSEPAEARTDEQGHYRLEDLPAGSVTVTVRRPGATLGVSQLVDVPEGGTVPLDFSLEDAGTVEGVVRAGHGSLPDEPLAVLTFQREVGFRPSDYRPIAVERGGTFRMSLPPGSYELRVRPLESYDWTHTEPTPVDVTAGETVRVELTWDGNARQTDSLRGIVLEPNGQPSPEAFVTVSTEEPSSERRPYAVADAQGRFSLSIPSQVAGEAGRLKLVARNGGRMGELSGVRPGEQQLVLKLQPAASVRGRVVRPGGSTPVKGFTLAVQSQDLQNFPLGNGTWEFPGDRFELRDMPAEPIRLLARTTDGAGGEALITPSAGAPTEVEISLKGTARIRGRVVDLATLEPLPGVMVLVVGDQPLDPDKATDTEGRFSLSGVAPGQRSLLVVNGKDYKYVPVTLKEGQEADVGDVQIGTPPD